jgi:hypothetical protein
MRPMTIRVGEPSQEQPPAAAPPPCPVCSGHLIELRGFVRCARCHFSMCAGCEGEPWGPAARDT